MTTKIINLTLNGFHGFQTHRVRATFDPIGDLSPEDRYFARIPAGHTYRVCIRPSAADKFGCKMSDCKCGEGMLARFTCTTYDFERGNVTVRGSYPQRV